MADQRNLKAKASTADNAAKVENDRQDSVSKLAQAHDMLTQLMTLFTRICSYKKKVDQVGDQTAL